MKKRFLFLIAVLLFSSGFILFEKYNRNERFITYTVDLNKKVVRFYWKDEQNIDFRSIGNLKKYIDKNKQKLLFACNGGMYKRNHSPQGLYIENFKVINALDTLNGNGNFYLKPNGVFYITQENKGIISTTEFFLSNKNIKFATQSGPMLVIDNQIHSAFKEGSKNVNIRNGVGILENGEVVFVMSIEEINFYDFADYFKKLGCKDALYLDGFVSRTYLPEKNWIQIDGNFGVIIGITNKK